MFVTQLFHGPETLVPLDSALHPSPGDARVSPRILSMTGRGWLQSQLPSAGGDFKFWPFSCLHVGVKAAVPLPSKPHKNG